MINTHYSGVLRISVTRSPADAAREQSFIFTVQGPLEGTNVSCTAPIELRVMIVLTAGETAGSAVIKEKEAHRDSTKGYRHFIDTVQSSPDTKY